MSNYETLCAAARLTGGEVLTDARGMPDFFAAMDGGGLTVNGKRVGRLLMGKYEACERAGRLYALPLETPKTGMTFDAAAKSALEKGLGYHLMTLAEWALLCQNADAETGGYVGASAAAQTGRGAWAYAHNARWNGVWDAAGNVREWVSGYRTVDGEIQIIPENDAAGCEIDELSAASTLWRAIDKNGNLVAPGTAETLKWHYQEGYTIIGLTTAKENVARAAAFKDIGTARAIGQTALNVLAKYGIAPGGAGELHYNTSGERLAAAGACYLDKSPTVRKLCGVYTRSSTPTETGVRICFAEGLT